MIMKIHFSFQKVARAQYSLMSYSVLFIIYIWSNVMTKRDMTTENNAFPCFRFPNSEFPRPSASFCRLGYLLPFSARLIFFCTFKIYIIQITIIHNSPSHFTFFPFAIAVKASFRYYLIFWPKGCWTIVSSFSGYLIFITGRIWKKIWLTIKIILISNMFLIM